MVEIVYKDESYAIIGACFEVYNGMGCGFVEPVYQECLEIELRDQNIPFMPQSTLELQYKGKALMNALSNNLATSSFVLFV